MPKPMKALTALREELFHIGSAIRASREFASAIKPADAKTDTLTSSIPL